MANKNSEDSRKSEFSNTEDTDHMGLSGGDEKGRGVMSTITHVDEVISPTELDAYIQQIAGSVRTQLDSNITKWTPWFFSCMPTVYYQTTPRTEKVRHLSYILTGPIFETKQTVELWDEARDKVTYIGPGADIQILVEMAKKLKDFKFKMGALYFSKDRVLNISTFFAQIHRKPDLKNPRILEKINITRELMLKELPAEAAEINEFLEDIDNDFLIYANPKRIFLTYKMVRYMLIHEGAHTVIEPEADSARMRLTFGIKNVELNDFLEAIFHFVLRYGFTMRRSFVVQFSSGAASGVSVVHLILENDGINKTSAEDFEIRLRKLSKALRTLGWVDVDEYDKMARHPYGLSVNGVNLLRSVADFIHIFLGKKNPYIYSSYKVQQAMFHNFDVVAKLFELFRIHFDPLRGADRDKGLYAVTKNTIETDIDKIVEDVEREIMEEALRFIDNILVTNYFLPTKTGLAFRLNSAVLHDDMYEQKPFGIFYVVGRNFRFFQTRWKDISRGGLRVVIPKNEIDYNYALVRLFDEVYGLSYAQQLKNKDIPEGGSKAVLLLKPGGSRDNAVRGAVNAFLDLLVPQDEAKEKGREQIIDYLGRQEIIYLGPDENITNELIEWIASQAARRGYAYASAFMSSKPGAGINHKEYGVTSEGVMVFVENVLRYMGINPRREKFTVKMTGGPDGDVAGNALKILHREYGENAKIVAIADGLGAARDPNGLNWAELLRLFHEGKSIMEFNPTFLSKTADSWVITADTQERIKMRNDLTFVADADVFIPAGGRPYTVHDGNWQKFFVGDKPTMRAVVEGANIYFTKESREKLQERGVLSVKDSSANKTGVICSSYEIIGCLVMSEKEFKEIKPVYVTQVIEILRLKADLEARLLFKEFAAKNGEKTLVQLSLMISEEINSVTDALLDSLEQNREKSLKNPGLQQVVFAHCPKILVDKYRDVILTRLPEAHQLAIMASAMASQIVYTEGLGWLSRVKRSDLVKAALTYTQQRIEAEEIITEVMASSLTHKAEIAEILRRSGTRDLTLMAIEGK